MSHSRFADSLELLEGDDWLSRIEAPLDPANPLNEIETATRGLDIALLSNITDRRFPMAGQLMIDEERISRFIALEDMRHLAGFVEKLVQQATDEGVPLASVLGPNTIVKQPDCQQVVRLADDLDTTILPSLCVDPNETGTIQKITAATLFTLDPDSDREEKKVSGTFCRNGPEGASHKRCLTPFSPRQLAAGVDFVVESPTRLVPCWTPQDQLDEVRARYTDIGKPMPVAILLGGDPLIRVVADAPKPFPIDPTIIGTSLWKQKVEVTPCRTLPELTISADADMVIEGHWKPEDDVIEIQAVTHRINPIVPFAMPGERETIRRILLKGLLPWWRAEVPGLADLTIPRWEDDGTVLVGSVKKAYANRVQQIADTLAAHPAWSDVRLVILLDETVELSNESEVLAALVRHTAFGQKTLIAVEES